MTEQASGSDMLTYDHRADGVHAFMLTSDSREAVDLFIDQIEVIYNDAPPGKHIHLYIDTSAIQAGPPLRYIAGRMKPFFDSFPDRPPSSLAIITARGSVFTILSNFLNLFSRGQDRYRFFKDGEQQAATDWLLETE